MRLFFPRIIIAACVSGLAHAEVTRIEITGRSPFAAGQVFGAAGGSVNGFLAMGTHPSCTMIGPGVGADEETALALLRQALDGLRGQTLVFLAPCAASTLVRTAYAWGTRNVELHVAQSTAPVTGACNDGVAPPTARVRGR